MNTTPQDERDQKITDRLQELTLEGEIGWNLLYDQQASGPGESMQDISQPKGFIAQDPHHGFGRVVLGLYDEMEELHGDPQLYVQGSRVNADEADLYILLDAVQAQIDERREGRGKTPQEQIQERVEEEVAPLREEINRLEQQLERERRRADRLLTLVEHHSPAPLDDDPHGPSLGSGKTAAQSIPVPVNAVANGEEAEDRD